MKKPLPLLKKSSKSDDRDRVPALKEKIASIKDGFKKIAAQESALKRDADKMDKWVPYALGFACLVLTLLWYLDRRQDKTPGL